eukprot:Lankesteria_metandrocarpae@DN2031_c0_g1_i2.p1
MLQYVGANFFRQRLVLAILSGKSVRITKIRPNVTTGTDRHLGLFNYEVSFLQLLEKITDGSKITINDTGTAVTFHPGIVIGGDSLVHECDGGRSVVYYLEALLMLAPFAKGHTRIVLRGVTQDSRDISVDAFRMVTLPLLKHCGIGSGAKLEIRKRGCMPNGGGEVLFECPIIHRVQPFQLLKVGRVKRIRGVAYCCKVSPQFPTRCSGRLRAVLNEYLPDVWIYMDPQKGPKAGNSKGYGVTITAETIKGNIVGADVTLDESNKHIWASKVERIHKTTLNASMTSGDAQAANCSSTSISGTDPNTLRIVGNMSIEKVLQANKPVQHRGASQQQNTSTSEAQKIHLDAGIDSDSAMVDDFNSLLDQDVQDSGSDSTSDDGDGGGKTSSSCNAVASTCNVGGSSESKDGVNSVQLEDVSAVETTNTSVTVHCVGVGYRNIARRTF